VTGPDGRGDGDGWVVCDQGHRHWGHFGAAGLLLARRAAAGGDEVLLQHRATWSHHGGTWGILGGARHSDESAVVAALREAAEEGGLDPVGVTVHGQYDDAHGGWTYTTVPARTEGSTEARPTGGESIDVAWFPRDAVAQLPLHPGFAEAWPTLRDALQPLRLVVDVANVMGSRPDGWWRDRVGAARRLVAACARLGAAGIAGTDLPDGLDVPPLTRWWPKVIAVVEGAARAIGTDAGLTNTHLGPVPPIELAMATGSGDDEIVAVVERAGVGPVLVVTADRELRHRVQALGAVTVGPSWLHRLLDAA